MAQVVLVLQVEVEAAVRELARSLRRTQREPILVYWSACFCRATNLVNQYLVFQTSRASLPLVSFWTISTTWPAEMESSLAFGVLKSYLTFA